MKRGILFFIIGFACAAYYFTGSLTLNRVMDHVKPVNVESVVKGMTDIGSELVSGIFDMAGQGDVVSKIGNDVISSLNGLNDQERTDLLNQVMKQVEKSLTPEQVAELKSYVNDYFKDKVINEYKNSNGQIYSE